MNMKKRYQTLNLQFFAEGGDGGDGDDAGEGDDQDEDDSDEDGEDEEEKKYSQKDMNDAVKKRLAREKRKWQREQQKKQSNKDDEDDKEESEDSKARKEAEDRASKAEVKVACYEAGVSKESVDDVVALARSYMAADEDLDLEDAIEKVVKKYPQFKSTAGQDDEDDSKGKSWGERQKGQGAKKMSGVEKRFYELNPDLKK